MFKFTGSVHHLGDTEQVTEKFSKRVLVLNDGHADYPQLVSFEFVNDKTQLLDGIKHNEEVEVSFGLRGREWTSKDGEVRYFNTLSAFNVEKCSKNVDKKSPSKPEPVKEQDGLPF
jgi:hypothetical protein